MLLCTTVLMTHALDKRQEKINSIKKSRAYLYSDMTMSTLEDALSQAFGELQQEIFIWATDRTEKKPGDVSPTAINQCVDTIMVRRADMYRVFAYVKKTKLVPLFNEWNIVLIDGLDTDEGNELSGLPEDVVVDTLAKKPSKDTLANKAIVDLLKNSFLGKKDGVIERIKKARTFFELRTIMEPLKEKGDISDYGKYATAIKPEDCYLVVYDAASNIKAILGKGDKVRQNLNTGKEDSIDNYRGCGAIWFTINE